MTVPNITIISDRWLEALDRATGYDRRLIKSMQEWCDTHTSEDFEYSAEQWFAARHEDGRIGALFEWELDDDVVPTPEQIERARAYVAAPGEFHYVPPGGDVIFNGRAAYWAFFPGKFFDIQALNATARGIGWGKTAEEAA